MAYLRILPARDATPVAGETEAPTGFPEETPRVVIGEADRPPFITTSGHGSTRTFRLGDPPERAIARRFLEVAVHADGTWEVTTDLTGSFPAYVIDRGGYHEIRTKLFPEDVRIDPEALALLLGAEHLIGDRTIFRGVRLVPPATRAAGTPRGRLTLSPWWTAPPPGNPPTRPERAAMVDRLVEGVRALPRPIGISMSGGLDSRALLAVLLPLPREALFTVTHGSRRSGDLSVAGGVARRLGIRHHEVRLDLRYPDRLVPDLDALLPLTSGQTSAFWTHGMATADHLREGGSAIVGNGGEIARAYFHHRTGATDVGAIEKVRAHAEVCAAVERGLGVATGSIETRFTEHASAWFASRQHLSPVTRLDVFYLQERARHMGAASLAGQDGRGVPVVLPFLDATLTDVVLRIPPAERDRAFLHRALLGRGAPLWLRGLPTDAGRVLVPVPRSLRGVERNAQRVYRKLMRFGPPHHYPDWTRDHAALRADARSDLSALGFDPDVLDRLLGLATAHRPGAIPALGNLVGVSRWTRTARRPSSMASPTALSEAGGDRGGSARWPPTPGGRAGR